MVELLRVETKITEESDSKQIAKASAESYRGFLKSRAVFAPEGDLGQRGETGRHSFRARRYSEVRPMHTLPTNLHEGKPRRSHSSDNILEEVQRYDQRSDPVLCSSYDTTDIPSNSVKRSKFEYIKQLFSKKPDKPRKFSTQSLPSPPPPTRTSFMFQRASDVTSNYSTSDYASDQELEDPTPLSRHSVRPAPYANRNSKIANIVKRFEPKSANENDNPDTSTATPPSEPVERTHSQALLEIQAISSNLSSLMTNLSIFSQVEDTVGSVVNSPKKLIVNTLMESQINEDKQRTPKVTTSYFLDDKSRDVTADSCHSSEHGEDVISLDDFLINLTSDRPPPPSRYPRVPREEERDSDSTEMGSGSLHNSIDTLLEEVNKVVADVTSPNTESSISDNNFTSKAPFIDSSRVEDIIPRHSTEVKYTDILPPSLLPTHTHDDITSQASDVTLSESILQIENTPVKNSSAENAMPSDESYMSDANLFKIQFPYENADNLNSDLRSPLFSSHRHTLSTDDAVSTGAQPTMVRSTTLDTFTTSPLFSTRIKLLDNTPTDVESSDVTSTHSMPMSPVIKHKYDGYALPYGQSRSVSERIHSLLSRDQVDHHPKVDKLSVARAAIERKRSEVKPIIDRSVLIEVKEPEEFSVKSLRERFEAKMKQMEPSGVMLTPSQLPLPARKKGEDLGIKPTFAGVTRKCSSVDLTAMRNEYNTDGDANTNKSLVQPKYTIK